MLFNSFQFLLFFPVVTALYFLLPHRFRWALLLLASCLFYMAFIPAYIAILGVTILIDYVAALWIETPGLSAWRKKALLAVSIVATCMVLFVFKYFDFFNTNFNAIAEFLHWNYSIPAMKYSEPRFLDSMLR